MSALARKLAGLRRQAGSTSVDPRLRGDDVPAGMRGAADGHVGRRGGDDVEGRAAGGFAPAGLERIAAAEQVAAAPIASSTHRAAPATAPARRADPAAQLRRLLNLRPQAPLRAAPAADRRLEGEEIAPGLYYTEAWTPWPRQDALLLHGIGQGEVERERVLAFDTETTGLAGGTGTRAFMIGAADWHAGGLRLRQLLIATLAAETAMLRTFAGWLGEDTVLLSYNGKSYDRPLLSTRYRLARLADPLPACGHIDLLHPMRRRYRTVWPNCRLATAEHELLGVVREDDLPGSQAPAAWLQYLRGGSAATLRRVGDHNAQDLRSLCGLLERLAD